MFPHKIKLKFVHNKINLKFVTRQDNLKFTNVLNVSIQDKIKDCNLQDKIKFVTYKIKLKFTNVLNVSIQDKIKLCIVTSCMLHSFSVTIKCEYQRYVSGKRSDKLNLFCLVR